MPLIWTHEEDELLIDFVKKNEILFNIKCQEYRNAQKKKQLWLEVAFILEKSDTDCAKRWAYIRDYYIRKKGKPGTGSCGEAAKKRSKMLSFLDSFSSSKKSTITNVDRDSTPTLSMMEESFEENEVEESQPQFDSPAPPRKKQKLSRGDERIKLLKAIADKQHPEVDETTHFMISMAKIVAKLPLFTQANLRLKIANIVGEAELDHLRDAVPQGTAIQEFSFTEDE